MSAVLMIMMFFCSSPDKQITQSNETAKISQSDTRLQKWINQQVEEIKKLDTKNPAEKSKALFSNVFITHHVTADETTLPSDWGKVTADGTSSFPMPLDPYDLAERMRRVCEKLEWKIGLLDTDLGPAFQFGEGDKAQVTLIKHGQYGHWKRFKGKKKAPKPIDLTTWNLVLKARKALLHHRSGKKNAFEKCDVGDMNTPLLAEVALRKGKKVTLEKLYAWCYEWTQNPYFTTQGVKQGRQAGHKKMTENFVILGEKHPSVPFFLEVAKWERNMGHSETAKIYLKKALKIDPHHSQTLQLLNAIDGK